MDPSTFEIAGVSLLLLIPGIVEAVKRFGVKKQASFILSLTLSIVFVTLSQAIAQGAIPAIAVYWINITIAGIGGGLALCGYYDLSKRTGLVKPRE